MGIKENDLTHRPSEPAAPEGTLPGGENDPGKPDKKKKVVQLELPSGYTIVSEYSPFAIKEAYKYIRTNLLFTLVNQNPKIVVCSSALPSEGKSTTCCNMAITMAQTDASVLLIDSDMRKPVQHRIFKKMNTKGLSNVLGGFMSLSEVLHTDVVPNLDLITAGSPPPNPSELLVSGNMQILLEKAGEEYDYVFIDSPPINVISDAVILAGMSTGIVLVTKQGQSQYGELQQAIDSLRFAKANVLGVVLNGAKRKSGSYGKYGKYAKKGYYEYDSKD